MCTGARARNTSADTGPVARTNESIGIASKPTFAINVKLMSLLSVSVELSLAAFGIMEIWTKCILKDHYKSIIVTNFNNLIVIQCKVNNLWAFKVYDLRLSSEVDVSLSFFSSLETVLNMKLASYVIIFE